MYNPTLYDEKKSQFFEILRFCSSSVMQYRTPRLNYTVKYLSELSLLFVKTARRQQFTSLEETFQQLWTCFWQCLKLYFAYTFLIFNLLCNTVSVFRCTQRWPCLHLPNFLHLCCSVCPTDGKYCWQFKSWCFIGINDTTSIGW